MPFRTLIVVGLCVLDYLQPKRAAIRINRVIGDPAVVVIVGNHFDLPCFACKDGSLIAKLERWAGIIRNYRQRNTT